jgi:hypothetical protein
MLALPEGCLGYFFISPESREQFLVRQQTFFDYLAGIIHFPFPFFLHRGFGSSPTKRTPIGATQIHRHLHALMGTDAIELEFVASPFSPQHIFGPSAHFHGGMVSHDSVLLMLKLRAVGGGQRAFLFLFFHFLYLQKGEGHTTLSLYESLKMGAFKVRKPLFRMGKIPVRKKKLFPLGDVDSFRRKLQREAWRDIYPPKRRKPVREI